MRFNTTLGDGENVTSMTDLLGRLAGICGQDEDTGRSDWSDGWCARFGRRLFFSSDYTGDFVHRYPTTEQACAEFARYNVEYSDADDDEF